LRGSTQSHPPKLRSLTFLKQKKSQLPKWKRFQTFSIMANKSFTQQSKGKDNLIKTYSNLLKIRFRKRTHVFDNAMISLRKLFKKDSVSVIKNTKSHHKTKFLVICNNLRIASTRTQSNFRNNMSFLRKTGFRKIKFIISKLWYF
jgi:hypothetical protein